MKLRVSSRGRGPDVKLRVSAGVFVFLLPYFSRPTLFRARGISRFCMNQRQMFPVRMFSALRRMMPALMPMTSVSIQPVLGLKASMKPYLP